MSPDPSSSLTCHVTGDQYLEYSNAPFTITDGPYGTTFFTTTGFHGESTYYSALMPPVMSLLALQLLLLPVMSPLTLQRPLPACHITSHHVTTGMHVFLGAIWLATSMAMYPR